jgi:demethylmenaquinone methyltransferase / 2-methoxy-6-polyprenyl-1,4-benzoquinol methylase
MFGGIAGSYDLLNHLLSLNQDKVWRRRAREVTGGTGPFLDVCAGTGDMALEWVEAAKGGVVTAADFCEEMLVLGRAKVADLGIAGKVRFLAADTRALPFLNDRFGVVSVAFGIRNVSDLRGGIREMIRVARPGGKVVILEFTMPRNPVFRAVYLFYFMLVLPFVGNLVSGTEDSAYGYLPRSVLNFPNRSRLMEILAEEGLQDVAAADLSLGIVNVLTGTKRREAVDRER